MAENPYPNLGFNPVPGLPADVDGLRTRIDAAATAIRDTNAVLTRLRDSNDDVWKGEAGNAFRTSFDATLAQDLGHAQSSLEEAVGLLDEWYRNLVTYQDTARLLEIEAANAVGQQIQATTALRQAQANPDLQLAGKTFDDPAALASAQARLDVAAAAVRTATDTLNHWNNELTAIRQRATTLQGEHNTLAKRIATDLDAAAANHAPSEPDKSIWDRLVDAIEGIGDWISEHRQEIHDVLAGVSAVTGLLALVTPPPADAIFAVIALTAGVGALAMDFLDPEVRQAIGDFTNDALDGDWNGEALKKVGLTVGLDTLSIIPGATGAIKGVQALNAAGDLAAVQKAFAEGAAAPGLMSKGLNWIPRPDSATVWLTEFGELGQRGGDALAGIELVSRSAKAGLGLTSIGEVIGSYLDD